MKTWTQKLPENSSEAIIWTSDVAESHTSSDFESNEIKHFPYIFFYYKAMPNELKSGGPMLFQPFRYQVTTIWVVGESSFYAFILLLSFTFSQFHKTSLTLLQQTYPLSFTCPKKRPIDERGLDLNPTGF